MIRIGRFYISFEFLFAACGTFVMMSVTLGLLAICLVAKYFHVWMERLAHFFK